MIGSTSAQTTRAAVDSSIAALGHPGLAVISLRNTGDGLAYAATLIERACADLAGAPVPVVELASARVGGVALSERLRFAARLLRAHATGAADFWIYAHMGIARARPWVAWLRPRPYALFLNGIEAWAPELRPASVRVARQAAVRIAISAHTARRVAAAHPELGPIEACPLALLPEPAADAPGADPAVLARVRPRSILIVGRMSAAERYKGHDQLIECWPRVLQGIPDAQLVIAGRGDDAERLRRKAGALGLGDAVCFTGFVSDATREALCGAVAGFCMPSRGEGFGLVYLQAMRRALPCIGCHGDAAADIIRDGETGFLVGADDREALAARLVAVLSDPALGRRLGAAGQRRYEAEYTYECFRARLGDILSRAFPAPPRSA